MKPEQHDRDQDVDAPRKAAGAAKVALLADLHIDSAFRWAGHEAGARWRRALRETLVRSVDVAIAEGVDAFFLAGDIYEHDLLAPDTARFIAEQLARLDPTPVLVAPGNHDYLCPSSVWVQAPWSPNVVVFEQQRWTAVSLREGLTVWGIAHGQPAGTGPLLDRLVIDRGGVNVALFHGALRDATPFEVGAHLPHLPFELADIERIGLAHAFCGHYHSWRHDRWLTYPGNPHPLVFGESEGRGLAIASIQEDGQVEAHSRQVAPTTFHDLSVDLSGAHTSDEVRSRITGALGGCRGAARVRLAGELAVDVDLGALGLQDMRGQLDAVAWRLDDLRPGYDLDAIAKESTVRGQFVRDVLDRKDLTPQRQQAVLLTGLRALEGRRDLTVAP